MYWKEIIIKNKISNVFWDFLQVSVYCLIMKCSLVKYNCLIIFLVLSFILNPVSTESSGWCVSTCSHPDCRISVQVCPWFSSWRLVMAEQNRIHLHWFLLVFFFSSALLPLLHFCLSIECGRLPHLSLESTFEDWDDYKIEEEEVVWSTRIYGIYGKLLELGGDVST